jgi:hypothetical protein
MSTTVLFPGFQQAVMFTRFGPIRFFGAFFFFFFFLRLAVLIVLGAFLVFSFFRVFVLFDDSILAVYLNT